MNTLAFFANIFKPKQSEAKGQPKYFTWTKPQARGPYRTEEELQRRKQKRARRQSRKQRRGY